MGWDGERNWRVKVYMLGLAAEKSMYTKEGIIVLERMKGIVRLVDVKVNEY